MQSAVQGVHVFCVVFDKQSKLKLVHKKCAFPVAASGQMLRLGLMRSHIVHSVVNMRMMAKTKLSRQLWTNY